MKDVRWAVGVTTCPQRRDTLLPKTLASLNGGGFEPRVFMEPSLSAYSNWLMAIVQLYLHNTVATHFAVFQDDLLTCKNLRAYLTRTTYQVEEEKKLFYNLYTVPENDVLAEARTGWYLSNQMGRGAVGYVFSKAAVLTLLTSRIVVEWPQEVHHGHRGIDAKVLHALKPLGWREMVHHPSLVQHTGGDESALGNPLVSKSGTTNWKKSECFAGEEFDCLSLL